jgi:AraC family transcriptional activator of pobA
LTKPRLIAPSIPGFFLYGEPPREVQGHFLHLEPLDDRSRPNDWDIRPHAHSNLNHVFFIASGAGEMRTEQGTVGFIAPVVLLVPARFIHGFHWQPETSGHVLTIADAYLAELIRRAPDFERLFARPDLLEVPEHGEGSEIAACLNVLGRELTWNAPAHRTAVEAHLLALLVRVARIAVRDHLARETAAPGPQAELLARFRELVEAEFRLGLPIASYAERLGVSLSRLRAACLTGARRPPIEIVQERLILEARRLLLYSNMTVAEVGYVLGFEDPAYFTRFFKRRSGESPGRFRSRA